MDRINLLKFILIAFALPAQYFITQHWSNNNVEQSQAITNLVISLKNIKQNYFEFESWKKWYLSFFLDNPSKVLYRRSKKDNVDKSEDVAVEVLTYRKHLINFAESSLTRSPRPSKVLFRVGQVVHIKRFNMYGVIIGWDEKCNAPFNWIERNYEEEERHAILNQPHYLLLVDEKYQEKYSDKVYIYQDDLEKVQNKKITHRILSNFFSDFDGGQYLKKKYLQTVYPHD